MLQRNSAKGHRHTGRWCPFPDQSREEEHWRQKSRCGQMLSGAAGYRRVAWGPGCPRAGAQGHLPHGSWELSIGNWGNSEGLGSWRTVQPQEQAPGSSSILGGDQCSSEAQGQCHRHVSILKGYAGTGTLCKRPDSLMNTCACWICPETPRAEQEDCLLQAGTQGRAQTAVNDATAQRLVIGGLGRDFSVTDHFAEFGIV